MNQQPLISITIPTYNRAVFLQNLLQYLVSQIKELGVFVEICVSNNCSTDTTREMVMDFQKKYPGLIKYNENEKNLGFDRNLLKAIEMATGEFVWTFGDDDLIANNGLKEVVNFINKINRKNTGLIVVGVESYFIDKKTSQRIICGDTLDKNKSEMFAMDKKDIIGMPFFNAGLMTPLIFNNSFLKKIIKEENEIIEKAIGIAFMHILLRSLIFLKYPSLDVVVLNKNVVFQELPSYKWFVEDKFVLCYQVQKKINNILLFNRHMSSNYAHVIIDRNSRLRWGFIIAIIVLRVFRNFNYLSYFGCLKLFFRQAMFIDALLFSFVFSILSLTPPIILVWLYKILLMVRHGKNWKERWFLASNYISITNEGSRRITV